MRVGATFGQVGPRPQGSRAAGACLGVAAHAAFMADLFPAVDIESLSACLEQDWGWALSA